jgi:hypothetical protein
MAHERRIITRPVLRPDGTVLQKPGLDLATGLLYQPDVDYPSVEDTPSTAECLARRDALLDLVAPWPFANPQHRSACLAGFFTCIARPLIKGPCPLFVIDSQDVGLRKTTLVRLTSSLAIGTNPAFLDHTGGSETLASDVARLIEERAPFIVLDNIGGASAPPAEALLSAVQRSPDATWWLTGNEIALPARLWQRSLRIALHGKNTPTTPVPELHDPKWQKSARPRLLSSALSLVRRFTLEAWRRPSVPVTSDSFDGWMAFMPGFFQWLDMPDPIAVDI